MAPPWIDQRRATIATSKRAQAAIARKHRHPRADEPFFDVSGGPSMAYDDALPPPVPPEWPQSFNWPVKSKRD